LSDAWLAFFGGILATLVGGLIASLVQRHSDKVRHLTEARLDVYFQLMELNQHYFWIASFDIRGEKPPEDEVLKCREIAWRLADRLRKFDHVEHLDEILVLLFSSTIESANDRANRFGILIEKYGKLANPTYAKHIGRISAENIMALGSGKLRKNNAPGAINLIN
jgi:hypothetical protein